MVENEKLCTTTRRVLLASQPRALREMSSVSFGGEMQNDSVLMNVNARVEGRKFDQIARSE